MAMPSRYRTLWSVAVVAVLWCDIVFTVDRGNFKTCDQSGFCKRQRAINKQPSPSPYIVLMDTLKLQASEFTVQLLNTHNNIRFTLEVNALEKNTARLKIRETEPIRPRYEIPVGDVLVGEPKQQGMTVVSQDDSQVSVSFENNKIVLQAKPFRIDLFADGEPVFSVNSRGLLKFEHGREKSAAPAVDETEKKEDDEDRPEEADAQEEKDENEPEKKDDTADEEPDMWEETFKSHQDSKKRGPESIGLDFSFPGYENVYGIPEHADSFALKTTKNTDPYRLYNLDVFEYELNNPMALYGSVPVMLAHNEKRTVGMFWHNAAETWVDITANFADKGMFTKLVDFVKGGDEIPQVDTHWFSECGIIDVFVMLGPKPSDLFQQYAALTGTTQLPPLFSLAYHQCRWNYNDQEDVAGVDANFDEHNLPLDVIWLDIEHAKEREYFTWDPEKFPRPQEMLGNLSSKGRKMVTIVDPHLKRDENFRIHKEFSGLDYYVKNKDGNEYDQWCWSGSSGWPDFTRPEVREYWAKKFALDDYQGSTLDLFTWNDMNEPSVFSGPEVTMHKDVLHANGWEHRDVHNVYGMYQQWATAKGLVDRSGGLLRPFVLTRAVFAGSQRFGAMWTGDNTAEWSHLKISLPMLLSLNVVGITFSGADVGGFFKNPDNNLLTRWYQAGAYQPFFRAHAHLETRRREPYLLPKESLDIVREALRARYRLLPYWYTLAYENEVTAMPMMRPLWVEYPSDKYIFKEEDSYMLGSSMLVHPVTEDGVSSVDVYFPGGVTQVWYDSDTFMKFPGGNTFSIPTPLNKVPVFYRGGYIVPRKERVRRSSSLTWNDPHSLIVALDDKGEAGGQLYMDDYHTLKYKNGEYAYRQFTFKDGSLHNKNANPTGNFKTRSWLERVTILGLQKPPTKVQVTGGEIKELSFSYDANLKCLVIRKPGVNMAEDWIITLV